MRPISSILILLIFALAPPCARAYADCTNPDEARDLAACFAGPRPAYLVAFRYSKLSAAEMSTAVDDACREFNDDEMQAAPSILSKIGTVILDTVAAPIASEIPTVLGDMFGSSTVVKAYEARLAEIGKIRDRYVRIREVYELAIASQGAYDKENSAIQFDTPSAVLENAKAGRPGGQCRDFAKLLEWSLLHVNRSPTLSEEYRKWGALDEDSFSVTRVNDAGHGHAWVDVLLPVGVGDKQVFHRLSLEPTNHKEHYVPLFQRRLGLSKEELDRYHDECVVVRKCADAVALKHLPTAKSIQPAPASGSCSN
ncbi:MAG: hypothetical protein HY074_05020 [Deltaproteobacteria bacterium]|nr:hypothetical protein [Deltaproteobacteria bacterium]